MSEQNKEQGPEVAPGVIRTSASATNSKGEKVTVECEFYLAQNLAEFVELYGEEKAWDYLQAHSTRNFQNNLRSRITADKTVDEIIAEMSDWNPNTAPTRQPADPVQKALRAVAGLSEDAKQALIQAIMAQASAK